MRASSSEGRPTHGALRPRFLHRNKLRSHLTTRFTAYARCERVGCERRLSITCQARREQRLPPCLSDASTGVTLSSAPKVSFSHGHQCVRTPPLVGPCALVPETRDGMAFSSPDQRHAAVSSEQQMLLRRNHRKHVGRILTGFPQHIRSSRQVAPLRTTASKMGKLWPGKPYIGAVVSRFTL